ncbi:MAG TPA: MFS transporter [Dehalococcoidales bacterium]|nr:MFS transporter [Dehalococcoidales bacterium]
MASTHWQRNLAASFFAELLAMTAFTFVDPLIPLYIQKVGNLTIEKAAFWAGIAASGLGIMMFFISPIWGMLADRFGRKLMVLRAMFGGAVILTLLGFAPNVYAIIVLRGLQGLVTGSVAAATALASSIAPRDRMSFAMGIIMLAVFGGQSIGPIVGGYIADNFGYNFTFYLSGTFLFLGGVIVLFLIKEDFQRPAQSNRMSLGSTLRLALSREMLPLLAIMCFLSAGQSIINPIISLRVKEINEAGRAATTSGVIFSLMGMMAAISSAVGGRLAERISLPKILAFSCFAIGLLFLPLGWASKITLFAVFLILTGLFRGGQATSTNSMVGLSVAQERQGIAYGLAQSANALGGGLGPLIGGSLASAFGLRPIFAISSAVFITAGFLVWRVLGKRFVTKQTKAG